MVLCFSCYSRTFREWGTLLIIAVFFYGLYKYIWTGRSWQQATPTWYSGQYNSNLSATYSAGTGVGRGGAGGGPGFWTGKGLCVHACMHV